MGPTVRHLSLCALSIAALTVASCGGSDPGSSTTPRPVEATAAGARCAVTLRQPDHGRQHLADVNHAYTQHPATSGPHFPVPLPSRPAVYTGPVPEARAVHNLEHGYVLVYYQASGPDALSPTVVAALTEAVGPERKVLMAPYAELPAGSSLDFAAWDELQACGREVTAGEALAAFHAFVAAYREGPLAPEPAAG